MTPYIDMHCDTLMHAWIKNRRDITSMPEAMVDVERLVRGNVIAQFFAIFMPPIEANDYMGPDFPEDEIYIAQNLAVFRNTLAMNRDVMALVKSHADLQNNKQNGTLSAFLTLEDGRGIQGKIENLEKYYKEGIRLITLTWNHENCFGAPNSRNINQMNQGLTDFGKLAIERMNELGIIIDVSHLSDGGFRDVVDISRKPFVASHSNCRALSPNPRNLTDDMIRTLALKGGVMGVNFFPGFLNADLSNNVSKVEDMVRHIRHMINIGGIESVGIGTDFDGITGVLEIDKIEKIELLFESLKHVGLTTREIEKIAYDNVARIIKDVMN